MTSRLIADRPMKFWPSGRRPPQMPPPPQMPRPQQMPRQSKRPGPQHQCGRAVGGAILAARGAAPPAASPKPWARRWGRHCCVNWAAPPANALCGAFWGGSSRAVKCKKARRLGAPLFVCYKAVAYFSGSRPLGLKRSTKSSTIPMVNSRIWAALSIRCMRKALSSAMPLVSSSSAHRPTGST